MHRDAFLREIAEHPEDDLPRLVFADWLEEQGDPQGELIRVQCELARREEHEDRWWDLQARETELLTAHRKEFAGSLRRCLKRWHFDRGILTGITVRAQDLLRHAETIFSLPTIAHVCLRDIGDLAPVVLKLPQMQSLRGLNLSYQSFLPEDLEDYLLSLQQGQLRSLNLRGTGMVGESGATFLANLRDQLTELHTLDFSYPDGTKFPPNPVLAEHYPLTGSGMTTLLEACPKLTRLSLAGFHINEYRGDVRRIVSEAWGAFADSRVMSQLESFNCRDNYFPGWGDEIFFKYLLRPLQKAPLKHLAMRFDEYSLRRAENEEVFHFPELRSWENSGGYLGNFWDELYEEDDIVEESLQSSFFGEGVRRFHMPKLVRLSINGCGLGNGDLQKLGELDTCPQLRSLRMNENCFSAEGMRDFLKGRLAKQLRKLSLDGPGESSFPEYHEQWRIRDEGLSAIAQSRKLANLRNLSLRHQRISGEAVQELAQSPFLKELRELDLSGNSIDESAAWELTQMEHLEKLVRLDLRSNPVSDAHTRLREHFGYAVRYGSGPQPRNREQESKHEG